MPKRKLIFSLLGSKPFRKAAYKLTALNTVVMNNKEIVNNINKLQNDLNAGLISAVPVPFDSASKFHESAHRAYLNYIAEQPVAGVAVWAHTGRGLMLDTKTAERVLSDWRKVLGKKILIAGVGSRGESDFEKATGHAFEMAERAAGLGADALMVYAPTWLRLEEERRRDELIVKHHKSIAAAGLPLILFYLYEEAGGINYSPEVLDELLSLPEVLGIKMATLDSVMTYQDVSQRLKTKHPDKLLITGEDRFLGYSLMRGAQAALVGMGAVCCELQSDLIQAQIKGDSRRFLELSEQVDKLAEVLFIEPMEGYIGRVLLALVHLGVIPREAAFDPWGPELKPEEFEDIGRTLQALGYKRKELCQHGF